MFVLLDDRANRRRSRFSYEQACVALRRLFGEDRATRDAVLRYLSYLGPEGVHPKFLKSH